MPKEYIKKLCEVNDWMVDAIAQIQAILALESGWDSQGGQPPDLKTIQSGFDILYLIAKIDPDLTKPHINPTRSGGIQFHWEMSSK